MNSWNLSENLCRLRRERKLTQEQVADFAGVTKASVSKWETGQSTPDIALLPRLASFFDVTVDELIGYAPQLSKEQIRRKYQAYAEAFAGGSFEETAGRIREDVKQYYSCYPFLFQVCVLWLNHYMLAGEEAAQREILSYASGLCGHIVRDCRDGGIRGDAVTLQAMIYQQMGCAAEAAQVLEREVESDRLFYQRGAVLLQAYCELGQTERAVGTAQVGMYNGLLSLVGYAVQYLAIQTDNLPVCEETISRIEKVAEAYGLAKLHPNSAAVFEYQAALCYAVHGERQGALAHAERYVDCLGELFSRETLALHGDGYFDSLGEWFAGLELGGDAPRDREMVLRDARESIAHPAFAVLEGEPGYERLKGRLEKMR